MISPWRAEIFAFATSIGVDPLLIEAQVRIESADNQWAWNPEPKYKYLWDVSANTPFRHLTPLEVDSKIPPPDFPTLAGDPDQEWLAQQASWGLMQVMGAVARESGYKGKYLTALMDPAIGLTFGIRVLKSHLDWAKGDREQALAAYNGGRGGNAVRPFRNAAYAAKVLATRTKITI